MTGQFMIGRPDHFQRGTAAIVPGPRGDCQRSRKSSKAHHYFVGWVVGWDYVNVAPQRAQLGIKFVDADNT
jgi:hypothetical protein